MRRDVDSPAEYLADLDGEQSKLVERIRNTIRSVMPNVEEGIRYGMLDYPGLASLAAQKNYVALYVAPLPLKKVLDRHPEYFPGVDAGKSCLRFSKLAQADSKALASLLEAVLEFRANSARD